MFFLPLPLSPAISKTKLFFESLFLIILTN
nr:MAG TPA: hypothetical protein [Caudoviricetes sp.]